MIVWIKKYSSKIVFNGVLIIFGYFEQFGYKNLNRVFWLLWVQIPKAVLVTFVIWLFSGCYTS